MKNNKKEKEIEIFLVQSNGYDIDSCRKCRTYEEAYRLMKTAYEEKREELKGLGEMENYDCDELKQYYASVVNGEVWFARIILYFSHFDYNEF